MKYIGLMDCNNFFVSCERLFRPDLVGKPVAVMSSNDGVIVARSQEVKDMGVPMGMPLFKAKQLVDMHTVTLFSSNFTLYRDISSRVMSVLEEEVGECDIYSVDEAFFGASKDITDAEIKEIRTRIIQKVGIPVSIGVAKTKTLAKVASEVEKKGDGVCLLDDSKWEGIAKELLCGSIWGLGRATSSKLGDQGITTVQQFMNLEDSFVKQQYGVGGRRVQDELRGIQVHKLGVSSESIQQSITSTRSFSEVTSSLSDLESALGYHVTQAARKLREKKLVCSRMYIEMRASRYSDFAMRKGSTEVILTQPSSSTQVLLHEALIAIGSFFDADIPYKKIGVTLGNLMPEAYTTESLFEEPRTEVTESKNILDSVSDELNKKFGHGTIQSAVIQQSGPKTSAKLRSKEYTTNWGDIPSVQAK